MILLQCTPTYPEKLWLSFRTSICDDLSYHLQNVYAIEEPTENQIFDYGLFLIDEILQKSNRSLTNYPQMPFWERNWTLYHRNHLINEQFIYEHNELQLSANERISKFNND